MQPLPEIVIRPAGAFAHLNLAELWGYRGTLWRKVQQRIRLQYDDMALGFFWAVARPLIMVAVWWGFRGLSGARMGVAISYPLYAYTGLVLWFHFTDAAMGVAMSLQRDASLLQKVYYPRLLSPLSYLLSETYNLALAAVPLAVMMLIFGEHPGWQLLLLPLVLAQLLCFTFGVGLIFSSLVLLSRDWERVLRFALYVGLWLSPVIYAPDMIPEKYASLYHANPMSGTLLALRSTLFAGMELPWQSWLYSSGVTLAVAAVGLLLFQRAERDFVDRI